MNEWELLELATAAEGDARAMPRALVVAAHPDDEAIALGGRLGRYREAVFLHATDGAPLDGADARAHGFTDLEGYRAARRRELMRALGRAGIAAGQTRELGIGDQRAAWELPALVRGVLGAMRETRAEVVVTHPYEGGHPDHDACAFAVRMAVDLMGSAGPVVIEAAFYHQRMDRPGAEGIETGCFLPGGETGEMVRWLSAEERAEKERVLGCFATQRETLQYFSREVERFRLAPRYDFSRAPHEGTLFYERHPWGMTGARFRELAKGCMAEALACR